MNTYPTSDTAPGKWVSILLTVLVHLALALFLFFGIRWQSEPPSTLEVGLSAAPPPSRSVQPPPPPQPDPPQPKPPKEEVVPPARPPAHPVTPQSPPEIAVKKPLEKKPAEPSKEPAKKEPPPPKPVEKPVEKTATPAKKPTEPAVDPLNTDYLDKLLKQETERTQRSNAEAELQKRLDAETRRVASSRNTNAYINAITSKIRRNLIRPPGLTGNPEAIFSVEQLPSGEVIKVRLVQSSGIPALDEAIERSIHRSSPLPLPEQKELFDRELRLTFRPLEE